MSLVRRGKRIYYYRRRRGTHPGKEYVASGDEAVAAAARDAAERQLRGELERTAGLLAVLCEVVDLAVEVHLIAAGFHRHDRGQWRKKRVRHATSPS